jgi:adenylate cyclase
MISTTLLKNKHWIWVGLLAFLIAGYIWAHYASIFTTPERVVLDTKFQQFQREEESGRIKLIMIDQKSLDAFAREYNIYWPWPRAFYALVQDYLFAQGADLVVLDIFLDQPDFDRPIFSSNLSDSLMQYSMLRHQKTVLASQTAKSDSEKLDPPDRQFPDPLLVSWPHEVFGEDDYEIRIIPNRRFLSASRGIGDAHIESGKDGIIREMQLLKPLKKNSYIPSLSLSAFLSLNQPLDTLFFSEDLLVINDRQVPLNEGKLLINWYSKGGVVDGTFDQYSFYSVYQSAMEYRRNGSAPLDSVFSSPNGIYFFGANAAGLGDIKSTPMSRFEPYPGVEIQATILNNLLDGEFITIVPDSLTLTLILLQILVLLTLIFFAEYRLSIPISLGLIGIGIAAGLVLFATNRVWFSTAEWTLTGFTVLAVGFMMRYVTEDRSSRLLRGAFSLYVPKTLVDEVVAHPEQLKLGGEKRNLTVLFSDLAGFTTLSEQKEPEELVQFLNEYLTEMTDIVFKHDGTLDKYIGDAIMAFWGAPVAMDDHAIKACKCVIDMQTRLVEMNEQWKLQDKPQADVRFGINTGDMIVGNMGSLNRFNYTVMGDSVNLAARLEPANKLYGTSILISEFTCKLVSDHFITRELDRLKVKGKQKTVSVYELIGENHPSLRQHWNPIIIAYKNGMKAYYEKDWDEAISAFQNVLQLRPGDGPSKTYINRIQHYQSAPPPENWDGVFEQLTK